MIRRLAREVMIKFTIVYSGFLVGWVFQALSSIT
jgi:hypothetical protein